MNAELQKAPNEDGIIIQSTDTELLTWLSEHGRVAKFSDGWNAWYQSGNNTKTFIDKNLRRALDLAYRSFVSDDATKFVRDAKQ